MRRRQAIRNRPDWAPLAKLAPLVQPAAIAGLMLEQTPSLTSADSDLVTEGSNTGVPA